MGNSERSSLLFLCIFAVFCIVNSAKINTPRVLLPWFENIQLNFTFEIFEGGCYSWSLSRSDIIDLEPHYDDSWGHCSRSARVSVSKSCVPPGSVIILAEEVNTGEILRGDVDIDNIKSLKVMSTTWKLYLEEAPEAFEVIAYDDQGNKFSTLEGVSFKWNIKNLGKTANENSLVSLVKWTDTDYEAPHGITEQEAQGLQSYSVLLYGQAIGDVQVTVCLNDICTEFKLQVVASVVLTPAVAYMALGDTLRYRVVRARAGRLSIEYIEDSIYEIQLPDTSKATIDCSKTDTICKSIVRGIELGHTNVNLMSGVTEVASASLTVVEPHSMKINLRPSNLIIQNEMFLIQCVVYDEQGHALVSGDEMLISVALEGPANVNILKSTDNGTISEALAKKSGLLTVKAVLYSIAGQQIQTKVEAQLTATAVDPLEVYPEETFVAWTDSIQKVSLTHRGGGSEPVSWGESETDAKHSMSLSREGEVSVNGPGEFGVKVHLTKYPHVAAFGRVYSTAPEYLQVLSSGQARVGKPHHLHISLTATHPRTGELHNYHNCDCNSFVLKHSDGPAPENVTSAVRVTPVEGACCVLECWFSTRGLSSLVVQWREGKLSASTKVKVRALPTLVWPQQVAALVGASLPIIVLGESLQPHSSDTRVVELTPRDKLMPRKYPDATLFTLFCKKKGDANIELTSQMLDEEASVSFEASCAKHVSKIRLEPADTPDNCTGGPRIWLRPNTEVPIKVTLLDSINRVLLDETGPQASWDITPEHIGIQYKHNDRLAIVRHPEYVPVPVPLSYYQIVKATEQSIGWSGSLKVTIPEATASIQAKVAAPLRCEVTQMNVAYQSATIANIATISGGSGRYLVEGQKGLKASIDEGSVSVKVNGPGIYDVIVSDMCIHNERCYVELNIEDIITVEVATARAVGVDSCIPISAIVKGPSRQRLFYSLEPEWRATGGVVVKKDQLCGVKEGVAKVKAQVGGVWSSDYEVLVFPPLSLNPSHQVIPPSSKVQLSHEGGPPSHLATLHYNIENGAEYAEVSNTGLLLGMFVGKAVVKLSARDHNNVEMASAQATVEVKSISKLRVHVPSTSVLVGSPLPMWMLASDLSARALRSLIPQPKVLWTVRDNSTARLYTGHSDDLLDRFSVEGISVRVVPTKPGVIAVDVRVRNMPQVTDTGIWESSIELIAVEDIKTSVEGLRETSSKTSERIALAVGAVVRIKTNPRSELQAIGENFELSNNEIKAKMPGHGILLAHHADDRTGVYRTSITHIEVSTPVYITTQPSLDEESNSLVVVFRDVLGRELIAPNANVTVQPKVGVLRTSVHGAQGKEVLITNLDSAGAFLSVEADFNGLVLKDEVYVSNSDLHSDRVVVSGSWVVCLNGEGWRAPSSVSLYKEKDITIAVMANDVTTKHVLKAHKPTRMVVVHQVKVDKINFSLSEISQSMSVLRIISEGLSESPIHCDDQQRFSLQDSSVELPFECKVQAPHHAQAVVDFVAGQVGCTIIPSTEIKQPTEVELCAEWDMHRTCTKVELLPPISVSTRKISLASKPAEFVVSGHVHALTSVKFKTSPGVTIEKVLKEGEIMVLVSADITCGSSWLIVESKLTNQELKVDLEKDCEVACGPILGFLLMLVQPYWSTILAIVLVCAGYYYLTSREMKRPLLPPSPPPSVLPSPLLSPSPPRPLHSRSPYSSQGPFYGDTTTLPDESFSPNNTSLHSRFL